MKTGFLDKLVGRLDRLDPESLQAHFLRLAQEKGLLETIFQSIQEGVMVIDGSGKLNYANKVAGHLLGFNTDEAEGRHVSTYLRDLDWDLILRFDEGERSKLVSREIEITYPEHRFVNFYIVPLALTVNGQKGAVVILRDVTHDRRHEESVVESERINAVKLLAAGVAHEIGNPLNALTIHLQLLSRAIKKGGKDQKENLAELVDVARNEVARLDRIITQFLRAIRPAKPQLVLSRIDNLLKETLTLLKQDILNRKIDVDIKCPEQLPRIKVDRSQIKQAFFNLIKNAFEAMPDGGVLSIILSSTDRYLAVSFRDTGIGIKPEDFGHIFEPYQSTKPGGSGLGLMIVQRIVQDHGGQIEVVSKPDSGASFTILLPLAEQRIRLLPRGREDVEKTNQQEETVMQDGET